MALLGMPGEPEHYDHIPDHDLEARRAEDEGVYYEEVSKVAFEGVGYLVGTLLPTAVVLFFVVWGFRSFIHICRWVESFF